MMLRFAFAGLLMLAAPLFAASEPVAFKTPTGTLNGTMETPSGIGPFPVVLMHAGSGPTDRNGNNPQIPGRNDMLKMIAESLASRGIASVRFDKRGIGASTQAGPTEGELRFETYIDDLAAWGRELAVDKRFSRLVILGHSEGALIGAVAAARIPAAGFISIAGASKPAGQLIVAQMRDQVKMGAPKEMVDQVAAVVKQLEDGHTVTGIPGPMQALFRDSVQPYLISWFKYDPIAEYAKLESAGPQSRKPKIPTLILQGTTDIQVSAEDAKSLAAAVPSAKLAMLEGANHLLKTAAGDLREQIRSYGDPSLPVVPKALDEIVEFVRVVNRK